MAVTDGLKNIQPTLCSGNFYKSIDKNFLVRKHQSMRRVFLLFIGVLSCGAFMRAERGLLPFYDLYANHQGKPEFWSKALEKTKNFVEEILKEDVDVGVEWGGKLERLDLIELSSFLCNRYCLEDFIKSDCFVKEDHVPLLINLFRLGYKVAAGFDASVMGTEGYERVFSEGDIDVLKLCGMEANKEVGDIILRNVILLYDEEEN